MKIETIVEMDRFELYTDRNGKYWLWNKVEEVNHVIRAKTEREAFTQAMNSAIHYMAMYKEDRAEANAKLDRIESLVKDVFQLTEEEYVE